MQATRPVKFSWWNADGVFSSSFSHPRNVILRPSEVMLGACLSAAASRCFRANGDNSVAAAGRSPSASNVLETSCSLISLAVLSTASARPAHPDCDTSTAAAWSLHLSM